MLPLTKLPVSAHPYDWEGAVPKRRPHTRALALAGATLILVLQFVDWLTTRSLLRHGYHELNPLATALLAWGWLLAVKAGVAATLTWRVARKSSHTLTLVCLVYLTAGAYLMVALGNLFGLMRTGAL